MLLILKKKKNSRPGQKFYCIILLHNMQTEDSLFTRNCILNFDCPLLINTGILPLCFQTSNEIQKLSISSRSLYDPSS